MAAGDGMGKQWWQGLMLGLAMSGLALPALAAPMVVIKHPWIRAMPPGSTVYAAYLELVNNGREAVTVVGAQSPMAASVSLHRSMQHDGMSHMAPLGTLVLNAGVTQDFAPGDLHLMLNGVTNSFSVGDKVQVCLVVQVSKGTDEKVCQSFPVVRDAPEK